MVFQGAGINWLETELANELHHLRLFPKSSPATSMTGLT